MISLGKTVMNWVSPVFRQLWRVGGVYLIWMFIHYAASHLYVYLCTPYTLIGFMAAPFLVASPHCAGLRWCVIHGAETITAMWFVIGTWLLSSIAWKAD